MNKQQLFIAICLFTITSTYSQNTVNRQTMNYEIPKDWVLYDIGDIGQVAIPTTLELRSENSVHTLNQIPIRNYFVVHKKIDVSKTKYQLIFQPLGYDNGEIPSTYTRVLIHYKKGKFGDFMKWNDALNLTSIAREEIDKSYKQDLLSAISMGKDEMKIKLISRKPIEIGETNGLAYIKHTYKRQMGKNPIVNVQNYSFYNTDEMVEITISHYLNINDSDLSNLDKIINTFNFTTKK